MLMISAPLKDGQYGYFSESGRYLNIDQQKSGCAEQDLTLKSIITSLKSIWQPLNQTSTDLQTIKKYSFLHSIHVQQ